MDDPRVIEIDTDRVLSHRPVHYGIIDLGSNSIRLVVYDDLGRAPFPRFNEKSLAALGAGLDDDGRFTRKAIDNALAAIRRFDAIAKAMDVPQVDILATEATRKAKNGDDLVSAIRAETGMEPRVISGEDEAYYSTLGVISGFFQPRGLVGDIGGGSLEVAEVLGDCVGDRRASMPLGALPVRAMLEDGIDAAKKQIDDILDGALPPMLTEPVFYAVGGGWRALARVHIAMTNHPISVPHGYEMPAKELSSLAKKIAKMSTDEIAALPDVPGRRVETLAASALVLWRVFRKLKPERAVFSAFGLREGWLYSQLGEAEQYRDPLVEGALAIGLPVARVPKFSEALGNWTADLFPGETQSERRVRLAVCALTDIAWRDHQKVRAMDSFLRLLEFPFIGISHGERAFLAVSVMARYGGKVDEQIKDRLSGILSRNDLQRAEILGRALLLGHRFSASVPEILEKSRLRIEADAVRLEVLEDASVPDSDAVQSRLKQLAKVAGIEGAEVVSE
ncbi:Ppx/GppA family phosphatase [Tropicimonas sediminicola]|uniref:Exopolyphosphatase / guanosine-5'-triphosphate,3'-diphosphate pyrophosphatase n=1 Tax=Tropicimonas sediminicola TaxID=1031541 RepID=A0A239FVH0_9RHOB|nr:Ppx/GppA family phosphatase [Tropicimonas sediminicola]SNS60869.1 exopolyphosphatase / guanosine-5'-triphosphate,3'-diphosphate pyrophosphatase [Tropicimonas sediminicola]